MKRGAVATILVCIGVVSHTYAHLYIWCNSTF